MARKANRQTGRRRRKNSFLSFAIICLIVVIIPLAIVFHKTGNNGGESSVESDTEKSETENVTPSENKIDEERTIDVFSYDFSAGDEDLTFLTGNGFTGKRKNGITSIEGVIVANKTFSLPQDYDPAGLTDEALEAWNELYDAAAADGISLFRLSDYRDYGTQDIIYNRYVEQRGRESADTDSARPGFSEHQTGMAIDINSVEESFIDTEAGQWLNNNAYKYGWTLRYPKGQEADTGYVYEPWHYRFVGKELAEKLYNGGDWLSLERYFGIPSKYM